LAASRLYEAARSEEGLLSRRPPADCLADGGHSPVRAEPGSVMIRQLQLADLTGLDYVDKDVPFRLRDTDNVVFLGIADGIAIDRVFGAGGKARAG
jgi:hypothetical protein